MAALPDVTSMALFCDFENIALGVRDANYEKFDIGKVLERLLLKGSIVVKKAYCDWERYKAFKGPMHEASFELIEIPHVRMSGKNSADIRMVVDALDLCYTKTHVETFVIISGDSDFSPLVSKLRENNKVVIGVGVKNSTSDLLVTNCDEFIFYDDLVRAEKKKAATRRGGAKTAAKTATARTPEKAPPAASAAASEPSPKPAAKTSSRRRSTGKQAALVPPAPEAEALPVDAVAPAFDDALPPDEVQSPPPHKSDDERREEALDLIVETVDALISERGAEEKIWGSMVKQALKRRKPGFNESYFGFRSFNGMLEAAASAGSLELERDEKSGGYLVRLASPED